MSKLFVAALQGFGVYLWMLIAFSNSYPVVLRMAALILSGLYTFATIAWLGRK